MPNCRTGEMKEEIAVNSLRENKNQKSTHSKTVNILFCLLKLHAKFFSEMGWKINIKLKYTRNSPCSLLSTLFTLEDLQLFLFFLKYPGSVTLDEVKRDCPAFGDKVCPFAKLAVKGAAGKCSAFEKECPFASCMTVGEFQAKLGEMRESHQNSPSAKATSLQYLREIHRTAKHKEVDIGSACPFFQTKGGCPFAIDTSGKAIFSPDYIVVCLFNL